MIISKTPVRISIGGGGTDLPSFFSKYGSYFVSAAIDKYVYLIVQENKWGDEFIIKYSKTESVTRVNDIENEIVRSCLEFLNISRPLEIISTSDVGGQSGLGSSGSFTVGLLNALHAYKREVVSREQLAEEACHIAMNVLKLPSGKQDEYIAAVGGFTSFDITRKGKVRIRREFNEDFLHQLDHNLYLFSTGIFRESAPILKVQQRQTENQDVQVIHNLKTTQRLGRKISKALLNENGHEFGLLMHQHWLNKRERSETSNPKIDRWYELALKSGAVGGKIMGAGGGGFFLFYYEGNAPSFIQKLSKVGLRHVPFRFDFTGSKVMIDL